MMLKIKNSFQRKTGETEKQYNKRQAINLKNNQKTFALKQMQFTKTQSYLYRNTAKNITNDDTDLTSALGKFGIKK